mgnify:FL=1
MVARIDTDRAAKGFDDALRQVDDLIDAFGSRYTMVIATSAEVSARLAFFVEGTEVGGVRRAPPRPVMVYNEVARSRVEVAMRQSFTVRGRVNVLVQLQAGAEAFRSLIVERLDSGGGDVRLDALAPSTIRQKVRRRQPTTPGLASRTMRNEIAGAQVVVRKVR